jgi:hypothetical protein
MHGDAAARVCRVLQQLAAASRLVGIAQGACVAGISARIC